MGTAQTFLHKVTRWPFIRQVIVYGIFGATAAAIDYCAFIVLHDLGLNLFVANVISVNIGIAVSFTCNAFFNFRRTDKLARRALVFFGVGWSGLVLSTLILLLGVNLMGLHPNWVKAGSIIVVAAYQFTINKLVTFRAAFGAPNE
ncbi:MAG: GtrA family protein [Bifidobacteriaceae bacterium]|nr:GtrA family protein [Bifidobacteriaceae bacterium]